MKQIKKPGRFLPGLFALPPVFRGVVTRCVDPV